MFGIQKEILVGSHTYRLGKRLGKGAIGKVFVANSPDRDPITVKKITKDWIIPYIRHAIEVRPDYPQIPKEYLVQFLPSGPIEKGGYVITTHAPGKSLDKVDFGIDGSAEKIMNITNAIRCALASLGSLEVNGLIHRDIDLENLVLSPDSELVTIIDPDLLTTNCDEGVISLGGVGRSFAMAPEMWNPHDCVASPSADMYSLGISAIRLFYGDKMAKEYKRRTTKRIAMSEKQAQKYPDDIRDEVNKLVDVILNAMNIFPDKRPNVKEALEILG
jgi:serine/threonine protein kinase